MVRVFKTHRKKQCQKGFLWKPSIEAMPKSIFMETLGRSSAKKDVFDHPRGAVPRKRVLKTLGRSRANMEVFENRPSSGAKTSSFGGPFSLGYLYRRSRACFRNL